MDWRRGLAGWAILVVAGALVGCAGREDAGAPGGPPSRDTSSLPPAQNAIPAAGCTRTLTETAAAQQALDSAAPGTRLCLSGTNLAGAELKMTRSGAPGAPIELLADGATVRALDVQASHVVIAGFTFRNGDGLDLEGTGLVARNNNLIDAAADAISCECSDTTIETNTVLGADGTGIRIEGTKITVRGNTIRASVKRTGGDADGMRFFGAALRISDNVISDISDQGYSEGEEPHADCFQTFDSDSPPTFDVVIANNRCVNVATQCLIGTGERGNPGVPPGVRAITFVGNYCDVGGSQAINLENYPNVEVRDTTMTGPNLYRGVHFYDGSVNGAVINSVVLGGKPVLRVDERSQPVLDQGNRSQ